MTEPSSDAERDAREMWERLRHDLIALRQQPGVLRSYPTPDPGYRRPPVKIGLAATATAQAADLHARYGDFVALRVGALTFPPAVADSDAETWVPGLPIADPAEFSLAPAEPWVVRSGDAVTLPVLLTNHSDAAITVNTNGNLTGLILDPATGSRAGGYSGVEHLPLVMMTAEPGRSVTIPVLIGTDSYDVRFGYALPAGTWALVVPLDLQDGRRLYSPPLDLTITH